MYISKGMRVWSRRHFPVIELKTKEPGLITERFIYSPKTSLCNKGPYSQSYGSFPVVMYGCESWSIKKAEYRRIDAFKLWCLRRLQTLGLQGHQISPF